MDPSRFDTLTRNLTSARSRRGALAAVFGGTLGLLGLIETAAKHRRRRPRGDAAAPARHGHSEIGVEKKKKKKHKKTPQPLPCTPACSGKSCGPDGCGGVCGTCSGSQSCQSGACVMICTPSCAGNVCGASDGCGGVCQNGSCGAGMSCVGGQCVPSGSCPTGQVECHGACQECCTHDDCPGGVCQELTGTCGGPCHNSDECGDPSCGPKVCGCVSGACIRCETNQKICQGACVSLQSCCPEECSGGKTCFGSPGPFCVCEPGKLDCNGTCKECCQDEDCTEPVTPCQRRGCTNGTCELHQFPDCTGCFGDGGSLGTCIGNECMVGPPPAVCV